MAKVTAGNSSENWIDSPTPPPRFKLGVHSLYLPAPAPPYATTHNKSDKHNYHPLTMSHEKPQKTRFRRLMSMDVSQQMLNRYRLAKSKPKCFVMFADLDGTFTPMDLSGKEDFIDCVREITDQCKLQVKFVPVSGRPAGYVLRVLHECRDMLDGAGLPYVCDYGAAEQGAVIVDAARSYGPKYMGYEQNKNLKALISKILKKNEYCKIISDEPDKLYTCSIHIKNEAKLKMTEDEVMNVYKSVRADIWKELGEDSLFIALAHNCMEVMHKEVSKSKAIDAVLLKYRKKYDIVGMCMCGDAENDKIALLHMSRMAEIPGVRAHVFTPSNAQRAISTSVLEQWKNHNPLASDNRIRKSHLRLFKGITYLIRDELAKKTLTGNGVQRWSRSYDDLDIPQDRPVLARML